MFISCDSEKRKPREAVNEESDHCHCEAGQTDEESGKLELIVFRHYTQKLKPGKNKSNKQNNNKKQTQSS
jgi:hypothetical protein